MILFSDHEQPGRPDVLRLKKTVELPALKTAMIVRHGRTEAAPHRAAINNMIFLTALRIAERQGYTHFLYLEEDCRVKNLAGSGAQGDPATGVISPIESARHLHWDERIFNEFFEQPRHLLTAGSVVAYNPYNHIEATARRFERYLTETAEQGRKMVIPIYGWMSAASGEGSTIFVNGAGGVYSVAGLNLLFPERKEIKDPELAARIEAWDFEIGLRLWKQFGPDVYEVVGYLPSVYSGYGNVLTSEADRLRLLSEGFALTHQIKSDAQP